MKKLSIDSTYKTPSILCDPDKGLILIKGRSLPEDVLGFYKQVFSWIDEYEKNPQPLTTIKIDLDYMNTNSSKVLVDIFKRFEIIVQNGYQVSISWYYDDEDDGLKDTGDNIKEILSIPFELVKR